MKVLPQSSTSHCNKPPVVGGIGSGPSPSTTSAVSFIRLESTALTFREIWDSSVTYSLLSFVMASMGARRRTILQTLE